MFGKKRTLRLTVDKVDKDQTPEQPDPYHFERNTHLVMKNLEEIGTKLFVGVVVYVLLDTFRQVTIAHASNPIPDS